MLDRTQALGEEKEGKAWWNRKAAKSQIDFTKTQPNPQTVEKSTEKQQGKNQSSDTKDDKSKKKGKTKGKGSK